MSRLLGLLVRNAGNDATRATVARRTAPWALGLAAVCLLAAGCSALGGSDRSSVAAGRPASHRAKTERSWFGSWFRPKEPPKPKSVNEFLRQPRVGDSPSR